MPCFFFVWKLLHSFAYFFCFLSLFSVFFSLVGGAAGHPFGALRSGLPVGQMPKRKRVFAHWRGLRAQLFFGARRSNGSAHDQRKRRQRSKQGDPAAAPTHEIEGWNIHLHIVSLSLSLSLSLSPGSCFDLEFHVKIKRKTVKIFICPFTPNTATLLFLLRSTIPFPDPHYQTGLF